MRRANNPMDHEPMYGVLVGSAELTVWLGLAAGAGVAHFFGTGLGFIVGFAVGFVLFAVWFTASARLEKRGLVCECAECHKQFRHDQLQVRSQREIRRPG